MTASACIFGGVDRKSNIPDNTLLCGAQQRAGKGWDTYFCPRIGDKVLSYFIDPHPDAPIVGRSVYKKINLPMYDLKSEYTRSAILTRSSKIGSSANANELRFEDLERSEQVFVDAERNLDIFMLNMTGTHSSTTRNIWKVSEDSFHRIGVASNLRVEKKHTVEIESEKCCFN